MAIKVKKKQTKREEAKSPDQIFTHTERVFNYIEKQRVHFLVGLGALLLTIIVVTAVSGRVKRHHTEAGASLLHAAQLMSAPVGEPGEGESHLPAFTTREARSDAVEEAIRPSLAGDQPAPAAELIAAATSFSAGDLAEAQSRFQQAASDSDELLLAVAAMQGVAAVQAETEDLPAARGTLEQMAASYPALEVFARYEMARLTEGAGNLEEARQLYRGLVDRYGSDVTRARRESTLIEAARNRADLLEVVLGLSEEEMVDDSEAADWEMDIVNEEMAGEEETQAEEQLEEAGTAAGTGEAVQAQLEEAGTAAGTGEAAQAQLEEAGTAAGTGEAAQGEAEEPGSTADPQEGSGAPDSSSEVEGEE